ncbi:MAG: sulfatase-like hydrolase/transferase [Nitrospira sp.]|nr:sulfatase-like hydrolase/transferase [Nitrospira sp.]
MFSLYLLKDVFFRWDGFSYYGTIGEFIPGVALITIIWTLLAFAVSFLTLAGIKVVRWLSIRAGREVQFEHVLIWIILFVSLFSAAWVMKRKMFPFLTTTIEIKLVTVFVVVTASALITRAFSRSAVSICDVLHARITPLVWLFGISFLLSVPLVALNARWQMSDEPSPGEVKIITGQQARPNILLVVFDTLTARDMSLYGYERPTTPFLQKWASKATVFQQLEAENNYTTPTMASMMTGKRLWTHRAFHVHGAGPVNGAVESLPAVLKANGYFNMSFVANAAASASRLGMEKSFDIAPVSSEFSRPASFVGWNFGVLDNFLKRFFLDRIELYDWIVKEDFILDKLIDLFSRNLSETTVAPDITFRKFFDVLDKNPPGPFFAWIQVFPPHYPYLAPAPYRQMFDSSDEMITFKQQKEALYGIFEYIGMEDFPPDVQAAADVLRSRYDEFIRYSDAQFENFIAEFMKTSQSKDTIIVFTSDHGESFEHGYIEHGGEHLYEQVTHLPLIIKHPGQAVGSVINGVVEQIDLPATILDMAGIEAPEWMEGRSLYGLMKGESRPSRPAFSMALENNRRGTDITKGTVAVWENDYKLIYYLELDLSLLFNIKSDPDESVNLIETYPAVAERLKGLIMENVKNINMSYNID